ncbi:MAG: T9SS type A sorting domain-containing protein, partial [Ignavibacterium sp.]|uniref:T9SS type A sorting domain-containing protein n=1 Tax=Ignavibacterium sp. TaxID=2651167 RepID=UPI00404B1019
PATKIRFSIPRSTEYYSVPQNVTLKIYDMLGKEVATLVDEYKSAGNYEVIFDASKYNLPSGVYFYQLKVSSFIQTNQCYWRSN